MAEMDLNLVGLSAKSILLIVVLHYLQGKISWGKLSFPNTKTKLWDESVYCPYPFLIALKQAKTSGGAAAIMDSWGKKNMN